MDQGAENYRRFLEGDEGGFVELVRCYKDGLILYLNSIVHNLSLAEELAEDTFEKHIADTLDAGAGLCDENELFHEVFDLFMRFVRLVLRTGEGV